MPEDRLNKQRTYWIDKASSQLAEVFFASLEGKPIEHSKHMEDLATSILILWRMDQKKLLKERVQEYED